MKNPARNIPCFSVFVFVLGSLTSSAIAQSVWDGGSAGTFVTWATAGAWVGDVAPSNAATTDLLFNSRNGAGTLPTPMNIGGDRIAGLITFDNINSVLPTTLNIDTNASGTTARTLTLHTGITLQNTTNTVAFRGSNGALSIVLGADNTFTTSGGSVLQISSTVVVSGGYGITTAGGGTVVLNGANTFSGGVNIGSGTTLRVGSSSTTADTSSTVSGGVLTSGPAGTGTVTMQDGSTLLSIGTGDRTLQNNLALNGNVTFGATSAYTGALAFNSTVPGTGGETLSTLATISLLGNTTVTANVATTFSDVISGAFSLTKQGAGTLTLTPAAASTYSGGTTVASGTLRYGRTGSLGTGAVVIGSVGGGDATLDGYLPGWTTSNNISTVAGSGGILTLAATGTTSFNSLISGTLTLNDSLVIRSEAATGNFMRLTGAISGSSNITKTGAGALRLENDNTGYSGTTTISTGSLQLGNNGTTGGIGTGEIINNATLTIVRSNTLTLANDISGTGSLVQAGTGITIIGQSAGSTYTYSGGTVVASGTLRYGRTGSLGTSAVTIGSVGGGDATLDNNLAGWNTANNISTVAGSGGTLTLSLTGSTNFMSVFSGTLTLNDSLTIRSDAATGFAMRMTGAISGAGNITKTGAGVLRLENDNTGYSGTTTISTGTVQLGNNSAAGGLGSGNVVNNSVLLVLRSNAVALTNQISGTGTLTQSGSGTTMLSNANTYSGGTLANGGSLIVTNTSGSATGTGSVTVTATLGGTGTIAPTGSNGVLLGGQVAPGVAGVNNDIGTLSFTPVNGNVTFQAGSSIAFQIGGNGVNDKVLFNASGSGVMDFSAMAAGSLGVTFMPGYTPALNDSFNLLDWQAVSGTGIAGLSTSLLSLSTTGFDGTWFWDTTQFTSTGVITIATLVPEPSRVLLVALGAVGLCLRRSRSRRA